MRTWRFAFDRRARHAWEFPPGSLARLQVAPGDRLEFRSQRGATLVEFSLALLLGVLPLALGLLQLVALLGAANTLNLATFMAARSGSVTGGDMQAMRRELARGLLPLYVPASRGGQVSPPATLAGYAMALRDVTALDSLSVDAPTAAQVRALGVVRGGVRVIPNESLPFRSAELQRANFLAISVIHCQPLVVPLAGAALAATLRLMDHDPRHAACIAAGRAPLLARAAVEMQSDFRGAFPTAWRMQE
jgi:hypothetical protein